MRTAFLAASLAGLAKLAVAQDEPAAEAVSSSQCAYHRRLYSLSSLLTLSHARSLA